MRSWLAPRIVFPLVERLSGRRPWTELRRLRALQWRSPEELEARALAKLRPLLAHAHAHVPYYRELFERAGISPDHIRTVADLARLPVSGKAELRASFPARVVADNLPARRRRPGSTSGSTGLPFRYYQDRADADRQHAFDLLSLEWAGVDRAGAVLRIRHPRGPCPAPGLTRLRSASSSASASCRWTAPSSARPTSWPA
jgi:phenylacetate-CoA ligase